MVDPLTASELASTGISICLHAAKGLKKLVENIKNVKKDLVELVREMERYRTVLGLLKVMTRELLRTKFKDMELGINREEVMATLKTIHRVSNSIAATEQKSGQIMAGINWTFKKSEAERLVVKLRKEQEELMVVVGLINATASLRSLQELYTIKTDALNKATLQSAFDSSPRASGDEHLRPRTWLGHVNTEAFSPDYVAARDELSNAAYAGNWSKVFQMLEYGQQHYQENWVNAFRIKPLSRCQGLTLWTPLHQAALWEAPVDVIKQLLDQGAFRTLRSRSSQFSYVDQTASEIASDHGNPDLARLLAAVIRSPVPSRILNRLEESFHGLIKRDIGERVNSEHLYLPELAPLTELEAESIWFELIGHHFNNAGYLFRLDGRDLLVRSRSIHVDGEAKEYRITSHHVEEIQDAVLVNEEA